jgi:hypothetical protein
MPEVKDVWSITDKNLNGLMCKDRTRVIQFRLQQNRTERNNIRLRICAHHPSRRCRTRNRLGSASCGSFSAVPGVPPPLFLNYFFVNFVREEKWLTGLWWSARHATSPRHITWYLSVRAALWLLPARPYSTFYKDQSYTHWSNTNSEYFFFQIIVAV